MQAQLKSAAQEHAGLQTALEDAATASAQQQATAAARAADLERQIADAVAQCNAINAEELHAQARSLQERLAAAEDAHSSALADLRKQGADELQRAREHAAQALKSAQAEHKQARAVC